MKRLNIYFILFLAFAVNADAQTRVKLDEIVKEHESKKAENNTSSKTNLKESMEKGDYHFQRWLWNARQHTDQQGYLVPEINAYREWKRYDVATSKARAKATAADQSDWKPIGPYQSAGLWLDWQKGGVGRINTMAFHPTDTFTYIVGSAGGGAWITKNDGYSWEIFTQNMMSPAVSDIDYNPKNPNTIYICTGDRDGSHYSSIGLIRSYDGGTTWDTTNISMAVGDWGSTNSLLINPIDTNSMILSLGNGIIKTFDAGKTWQNVTPNFGPNYELTNFYELVYHPTDTNIIFTACTILEKPTNNRYVVLFRSGNGGVTWLNKGAISLFAVEAPGRAAFAVTKSNPNLVKIIVSDNYGGLEGIYSSNNAGVSFAKIAGHNNFTTNILNGSVDGKGIGGQGTYDLCIAIDPKDVKHIVVGGVNSWESVDSGRTWTLLTQWAEDVTGTPLVHADHHFIGFHPLQDSLLFDCNDGGIYVFRPKPIIGGNPIWFDITRGINMTQYYRNAVSGNTDYVLGGAQDNGSTMINRNTNTSIAVGPGDGMECHIDPIDPDIVYVASQYGSIFKWDLKKGLSWNNLNWISTKNPTAGKGAWTTPFLIDPTNHNKLYAGYQAIYTSPNQGETWTAVSSTFSQLISRLSMSKASASTIYATEISGNNIHYTHDAGGVWSTISHPYNETMISDILVDYKNSKQFWITFPGYGANKTKVAMYKDGIWKTMNENLPDLPVYCIAQDTGNGTLYIGTYTGVYYRTTDMTQWEMYSTKHPLVKVFDIGINYKTSELVSATWGRGMWASPKYEKALGIPKGIPYAMNTMSVFPNPSNGQFTILDKADYFGNQKVQVRLIDVTGKTVLLQSGQFSTYTLNMQLAELSAGAYMLEIVAENGKVAKERVVIR